MASKKVVDNMALDGLSTDTGSIWALAWMHDKGRYMIEVAGYRQERECAEFESLGSLEDAMRELEPDLRKWRIGA